MIIIQNLYQNVRRGCYYGIINKQASGEWGIASGVRLVGDKSASPEEGRFSLHHSYIICSSVLNAGSG